MGGRAVGGLMLAVAVLLTIAAPTLLRPDLAGSASAAPMPEPPQVGDCLVLVPQPTSVPCNADHDVEVTVRWPADDPHRLSDASPSHCADSGIDYVGLSSGSEIFWAPQLNRSTAVLDAPPAQRIGRRGWTVCTVGPANALSYRGSVRDAGSDPLNRPAEFGLCADDAAALTSCRAAHSVEYLSVAVGFAPNVPAELGPGSVLADTCVQLAAELTARTDPTFDAQLAVRVVPSNAIDPNTTPFSGVSFYSCAITTTDARQLVGSVVGIGDAAVPFG